MIQRGWVAATAMQHWAIVNLVLAVLFGLPAYLNAPLELTAVCALTTLSLVILAGNRLARWGVSDLALGLLFGPLLTVGVALASFGEFTYSDMILGVAFGGLSVWVLQMRQLENLFRSKPEGFRTALGYWDFDWTRVIGVAEGLLGLVAQPAAALAIGVPLKMMMLLPLASVPTVLLMSRLWRASSPLASTLVRSDRWALGAQLSWTLWWILALGVQWL